MAVEADFSKSTSREVNPIEPSSVVGSTRFACLVFGEGYWSCPSDCANLIKNSVDNFKDQSLRCVILQSGLSDHKELEALGVVIRQPYQSKFQNIPQK